MTDSSAWIACPYCGASFELIVDPGGGDVQEYVEDCEICCRPIHLTVSWDDVGVVHVEGRTDEA
jgi:hypothetical protein